MSLVLGIMKWRYCTEACSERLFYLVHLVDSSHFVTIIPDKLDHYFLTWTCQKWIFGRLQGNIPIPFYTKMTYLSPKNLSTQELTLLCYIITFYYFTNNRDIPGSQNQSKRIPFVCPSFIPQWGDIVYKTIYGTYDLLLDEPINLFPKRMDYSPLNV